MIGKVLAAIILICLLAFSGWFLYQNLPGEPEQLKIISQTQKNQTNLSYGKTPLFIQNIRFPSKEISYNIDFLCPEEKKQNAEQALSILQEETTLSFYKKTKESEIIIGCSEETLELEGEMVVAGEGGPTKVIGTNLYNLITEGKVLIYSEKKCPEPVVAIHEILHVLGFNHSEDPKNIMYPVTSCSLKIPDDIISTINILYSEETLPDLYIENVTAVKKGRYLDFNITIKNQGLIQAQGTALSVRTGKKEINSFELKEIAVGAGRILKISNLKLPSRSTKEVQFIIDADNQIKELHKENNLAELYVE